MDILFEEKFTLLLLLIAVASVLWAEAPAITIRRSVALIGTALFGVYYATCYTIKEQLKLLGWAFGIVIVLCLSTALIRPEYAIMGGEHHGVWRGIYTHKNTLGRIMVLSTLVFLLLALDDGKRRGLLWGGFVFSLALLIFSSSKASQIICVMLLCTLFGYEAWRKRYASTIPIGVAALIIGTALFLQITAKVYAPLVLSRTISYLSHPPVSGEISSPPLAPPSAFRKDILTGTNRVEIWRLVIGMIRQRPWLGYGYGGFWLGEKNPYAYIWQKRTYKPPHAHNGLLDLWLELGLTGVVLFVLGGGKVLLRAVAWLHRGDTSEFLWPLAYLMFFALTNLAESDLLKHNNISFVLYVAVIAALTGSKSRQADLPK